VTAKQLNEVEAELRAILVRYEDVLEAAEIYGMEVLRRTGAKAHDWFAGVQQVSGTVKLNLLPMHTHPAVMDGLSPELLKHRTGASVLKFAEYDKALFTELEELVNRAFDAYVRGASDG
jgi:hypothetical protein